MCEKHSHNHSCEISKGDELLALLEYMVKHNASHTDELLQLSKQLDSDENREAYDSVIRAIEEYKKGNAHLSEALNLLK